MRSGKVTEPPVVDITDDPPVVSGPAGTGAQEKRQGTLEDPKATMEGSVGDTRLHKSPDSYRPPITHLPFLGRLMVKTAAKDILEVTPLYERLPKVEINIPLFLYDQRYPSLV